MQENIDTSEVHKFNEIASRWWDPESEFKPLHQINPLRFDYISAKTALKDKNVLDVGCGGGLLTEALAKAGANTTGIDMAKTALSVAKLHRLDSELSIDYHESTAEDFAQTHTEQFDVVTCLEMLEHVPEPASVINACAKMTKPGGKLFFSTINRNLQAYLFAIIGAEYVLKMLPKGTHEYNKFIKPSELCEDIRAAELQVKEIKGMGYNPLNKSFYLNNNPKVNYLIYCEKPNDL